MAVLCGQAVFAVDESEAENTEVEAIVTDSPAEYGEATRDLDPEGTSRFALKRLMVFAAEGTLADSFGAANVVYSTIGEFYTLEYDSPADTKAAYRALAAELGEDKVFAVQPMELLDATRGLSRIQTLTHATPDHASTSWGVDMMHLDQARDFYEDEPEPDDPVIVAILDSGINATHEMFYYTDRSGEKHSRLILYDDASFSYDNESVTSDKQGHGTHVAGIIADGTSHQIKLMPIKLLSNITTTDSTYIALLYARDHGADVINISLGFDENKPDTVELLDPVFREFREKDGIMCVAAAGNSPVASAVYPACSPYVEAVASLKYADGKLQRSSVSSYGDEISFAAPGEDVVSAGTYSDTSYSMQTGTSMACPHIAAAMAMIKFRNPDYTPAEMKYYLDQLVFESDTQPEGMYYIDETFGMPVFSSSSSPEPVFSIRNYKFKLKQSSFIYTSHKNYHAHVENEATYLAKVPWSSSGTYLYTAAKDSDFVEFSWANCDRVGTAVLGLRGVYPNLIGDKYYSYKILPAGSKVTKLVSGKKALTVRWKKQAMKMPDQRINGYQVQIATNKSFTKNARRFTVKGYGKVYKKITKLKARKLYYVRVRTYMKVKGVTYYSKWSSPWKTKTK